MFDRADYADKCMQRANVLEWLPFLPGQTIVVANSVPGAVLQMLKDKGLQLQLMSETHIEKLAKNPGKGNLDYVLLMGMEVDAQMVAGLSRKLNAKGRLIMLVHNRYGMSYLAGVPSGEETYFGSVLGKNARKTAFYSKNGIDKLLKAAEIAEYQIFYPDPDGAFTTNIYSDAYLPKAGECYGRPRNFTYDRLSLFSDKEAFDEAVTEGMYPVFANDFLVVTGEPLPQILVRYSNDRSESYQLKTEIYEEAGTRLVRKVALKQEGAEHLSAMEQAYTLLTKQYDEEAFSFVPCVREEQAICFPFVKGRALSELMEEALQAGDMETVFSWFHSFLRRLENGRRMEFSNYDFIFSNIIIDGDKWQVIDYEWTLPQFVPATELAFRAAYCFSLEHPDFPFADICKVLNLSEENVKRLMSRETAYQQKITGSMPSTDSLCAAHGGTVVDLHTMLRAVELSPGDSAAQIYIDSGKGFSEEKSYFVKHAMKNHCEMELLLEIPAGVKNLRVDPCEEPCLVLIKKIWWNQEEQQLDKQIVINGTKGKGGKLGYGEYVFATNDPNITIPVEKLSQSDASSNQCRILLEVHKISLQMANSLTKSIKRII